MCSDAEQYRRGWAAMTGRSVRDVYVPRALREPDTGETENPPYEIDGRGVPS